MAATKEILDRLKAQIAELMRIYGEHARDSSNLKTAMPAVETAIHSDALGPDDLALVFPLFQPWVVGESLEPPMVRSHNDALWETLQAHTTQADWEPQIVPALFKLHAPAGYILPWVQPTGAHDAYAIGDEVTHDNPNDGGNIWIYRSNIDANTTEPGRDGTFDRWWEPVQIH
jgi:hypothetical protein